MATKPFSHMTEDERAAVIRSLMEEGHTNKTAAVALGTTPGTVAGIRHRKKIPSRPKEPKAEKPAPVPTPKPTPAMDADPRPKPPFKAAVAEHLQCTYVDSDTRRCAYIKEEGDLCRLHAWKKRHNQLR